MGNAEWGVGTKEKEEEKAKLFRGARAIRSFVDSSLFVDTAYSIFTILASLFSNIVTHFNPTVLIASSATSKFAPM